MSDQSTSGLSLFDLLARGWSLDGAVAQIGFNHDDTTAFFRLETGKIALAPLKDTESPKIRTRLELETGRTTVRPRENPVAPLNLPPVSLAPAQRVCRFGPQGFAATDKGGAILQITAGGQVITRQKPAEQPVTALCSDRTGQSLAVARGRDIVVHDVAEMAVSAEIDLQKSVTCMTISHDGNILAASGEGTLSLIDLSHPNSAPKQFAYDGNISDICWNRSGSHLSCASSDKSFCLIGRVAGTIQHVDGYPAPVLNTAFSEKADALLTSGAFRLVGWAGSDLPQNDLPGTPLSTGKPGFVVINTIAAHPRLNLVASGYANGLVTISNIGTDDEMMVHQEAGAEISALAWSRTGEHLAIGSGSGKAAIVTFPEQMFK